MRFPAQTFLFALALLAAQAFTTDLQAQVKRIDASLYPTLAIKLVPQSGFGGPWTPENWALPVLEDGWTERWECTGPNFDFFEAESYYFQTSMHDIILFIEKVKLAPRLDGPGIYHIVEDIFLIPCKQATAANPRGEDFRMNNKPPILFFDDIQFPQIYVEEQEGPTEFLLAVQIPIQELVDFFGPNLPFRCDWFAVTDFDALGTFYGQAPAVDMDGNGFPDCCIEPGPSGPVIKRDGVDEKGSNLLNFLLNKNALGLTHVDVFEPQPTSLIPPLMTGMWPGESHNTRPWCFEVDA